MRHGKKFAHLGRKAPHRKYMLANMACSLIEHKSINTTVAKAKALKRYIEPIITKSKNDSTHNRRIVFSYLKNKYAVTELFRDISVKIGDRPGGYTRIIKLGNRLGDNASMALIELVDYNTIYNSGSDSKRKLEEEENQQRNQMKHLHLLSKKLLLKKLLLKKLHLLLKKLLLKKLHLLLKKLLLKKLHLLLKKLLLKKLNLLLKKLLLKVQMIPLKMKISKQIQKILKKKLILKKNNFLIIF